MNDNTSTRSLISGDFVNWYRIERVLGQGGFGITYLATDTNLDHLVALKEYLPSSLVRRTRDKTIAPITERSQIEYEQGLDSFLREARTLVKFRHPNIVRVMSVFEANGSAYLVMEYERGVEFRDYVKRRDKIDESELIDLFLSIIDGLDQVHQTGYLHRDIKPVNLIIRDNGSPVLLDFGSSRRVDGDGDNNTSFVSAGYTALEQYRAGAGLEVGPWTDIYALGGTLYFAITGVSPVGPVSRLAAHVRGADDPLPAAAEVGAGRYSAGFLEAVDWALSFQTGDRPATLAQWRASLQLARDQSLSAHADTHIVTDTFALELPTGQTLPSASKRPIRNRNQTRDKRSQKASNRFFSYLFGQRSGQLPGERSGKWLGVMTLVVLIGLASTMGYRTLLAKRELNNEMIAVETELAETDLPVAAIQFFREVLQAQPDNQRAQRGVEQGIGKIQQRVRRQIDSLQFASAAESIASLQGLGVPSAELVGQLEAAKLDQSFERQLDEIKRLTQADRYQDALQQTETARAFRSDVRLDELEQSALAGIERENSKRQAANEKLRRARIAEANNRQRARRQSYATYLANVESALTSADYEAARGWLENARALQIDDNALASLERRVKAAENFASEPLTPYEVRYAAGRFDALKEAIEVKNTALISQLSEGRPTRMDFLTTLFARYRQLTLAVVNVESALNPKRAIATLRIEALGLANGDIVYPARSYSDFSLSLRRERYGWSKIEW